MAADAKLVKELRDKTGISVMECKRALEEAQGDMGKALEILSRRSAEIMHKKRDRALGAGTVAAYVHNTGEVGSLVLLSCETDFVSKNEEFTQLARNIAMHAAAMKPASVEELLAQEYIKDSSKTIADLLSLATQKFGERTEISEFTCFSARG